MAVRYRSCASHRRHDTCKQEESSPCEAAAHVPIVPSVTRHLA
ncbi:hypothetical protein CCACVL1_20394 [Corchorus capsularis]|uniref:Uncharacterized protein n=1 Tax=Corchorus capsularis TaxID=210143 RepID=A0A1R3HBD2_COCAP|nr:hypothetical protein CCACVL1_20394 [Corchorus capsularis]